MTTLKVRIINESKILKVIDVKNNPDLNPFASLGCGISSLLNRANKTISNGLPPIEDENYATDESDIYYKPTELVASDKESIEFGFQTPNKRGNMLEKADSAIHTKSTSKLLKTPKTPKQGRIALGSPLTPTTPKTPIGRSSRSKSGYKTPLSKNSSNSVRTPRRLSTNHSARDLPETPYSLRKTIKKRIIAHVYSEDSDEDIDDSDKDENFSLSESEDMTETDDTEEDSFINEDKLQENVRGKRKTSKWGCKDSPRKLLRTPRRGRELKVDVDMVASTAEYFEHNSEFNDCHTSDHTLNRLEKPRLGPEALKSILQERLDQHVNERKELVEDYTSLFPHWMTLLNEGFNLFLCGVGSKKNLLSLLQEEILCDFDHLVINGFFPSLTFKSIFISILEEILELSHYPLTPVDQLKVIANHYNDPNNDPLYLIINNLDGPMLRNDKAQYNLSQLASCRNIHIIASLDHINSPLIFDGNKYSLYNPLWWDVTTLAPYIEETSYENSLLVQQTGGLALSSLLHVFKSLTPNAKGIFILLAKYHLNEKNSSPNYLGMSFGDLYQRCRESFFVNSDLTLRAQLTEFKDHKLIKLKRGFDGSENLWIPLDDSTLQEFLDQYEES